MISKAVINNFQSWKQVELSLDPGVNVIIGQSDSGKSAILRAIRWALWNRPMGDQFKSHWAKNTFVSLEFDDCVIDRGKSRSDNYYSLQAGNDAPLTYKAFKHDPPQDILDAHRLTDLNFQSQIAPFFLLQSSSGEVAKYLNSVAGLQDIDIVQASTDKDIRGLYQDKSSAERNIQQLQEDLKEYDGLEEIGELIQQAENIENEINQSQKKRQWAKGKIEQIQQLQERIGEIKRKLDAIKSPVEKAVKINDKIEQLRNEVATNQKILRSIQKIREQIDNLKDELHTNKEKFNEYMPEICPLCENKTGK